MPTGNTANAKIKLDIADVQAKIAQNAALLTQLQASYDAAAQTVKQAAQDMVAAQQSLNAALQAGGVQAASAAQILAQYQQNLNQATSAQAQFGQQILSTQTNLSALKNQLKQLNQQANGGAGGFAGMRAAYAQASILGAIISGNPNGLVFGFARLATTSATMRGLLASAFPVIGAVALTEVLYEAATGVYHLYQRFVELKNVEEEVEKVQERLWQATQEAGDRAARAQEEYLQKQDKFVAAADVAINHLQEKHLDLSKFINEEEIREKFKDLGKDGQNELRDVFSQKPSLTEIDSFIAKVKTRLQDANIAKQKYATENATEKLSADSLSKIPGFDAQSGFFRAMAAASEGDLNKAKNKAAIYEALLKELAKEDEAFTSEVKEKIEERIQGAQKESQKAEEDAAKKLAAFHKLEEQVRHQNEVEMSAKRLSLTQQGIGGEDQVKYEIEEIKKKIAAEQTYGDVVRELNQRLVSLETEAANQVIEARKKREQELSGSERALAEYANKEEEETLRYLREEFAITKEILEAKHQKGEAKEKEASDATIDALDIQKTRIQAAGETSGPQTAVAKQNELRQLQQIDNEIIAEKIRLQEALLALDYADPTTTDAKKGQDERTLADLKKQQTQQQITQNADMLKLMEQQYQQYFNTIQQGLTSSVNRWIETGRGFGRGMQQMGVHLVEDFTNQLIKMGVQWAQHELAKMMIHMATNQAIVTSDLATAAQGKAIRATDTMQTLGANAVKAASAVYYNVADYIPVIGPELAPVAAGAAFAAVMALGALASFDTGGVIPNTGIALVHKGEEVVTAPVTNMVKNMATQQRSTNINMNTTINNSGLTDAAFKRMASSHASQLTNIVANGLRKQNIR